MLVVKKKGCENEVVWRKDGRRKGVLMGWYERVGGGGLLGVDGVV